MKPRLGKHRAFVVCLVALGLVTMGLGVREDMRGYEDRAGVLVVVAALIGFVTGFFAIDWNRDR